MGQLEQATKFIENILNKNETKNISDHAFKQLTTQILTVIFKAMRTKNLEYDSDNIGDLALIQGIISSNRPECSSSIFKLINDICEHMEGNSTPADIKEIIEYINNNYHKDLSRDYIAEKFNINSKALSTMIKQELGTTFIDYLAQIRIEEASKLIRTTDMTITDIYEQIGFNNRTTFIRTFKKEVGITPSEYKKKFKK